MNTGIRVEDLKVVDLEAVTVEWGSVDFVTHTA